ncbi:hypothetical protein DV736_g3489, partial [Chaetothyriales sp. CBS 134916]
MVQSTIQHGQPVDLPSFTKINSSGLSNYLLPVPSIQEPNPFTSPLTGCRQTTNPATCHRRLLAHHLNISLTQPDSPALPNRHFNPTFLRLPSWATNSPAAKGARYALVTRRVTEGLHQESFICLADICLPPSASSHSPDTRTCTASDHSLLGPHGGLRCTTPPIRLNIPPTPALRCSGRWSNFPGFPGFHDPRIFWSNRGEPLIIVNSASQYGCLGLWLLDLRTVYTDLAAVLLRDGKRKSWQSPVIRYRHLTELTRLDRAEVEKNWMLFFPGGSSSSDNDDEGDIVVQYDIAPKYDFSVNQAFHLHQKPNGNGSLSLPLPASHHVSNSTYTTTPTAASTAGRTLSLVHSNTGTTIPTNLTSLFQSTCFPPSSVFDSLGQRGHWHQSTNALKLILCTRSQFRDGTCGPRRDWLSSGREVHFSIIHRKFSNLLDLPMRYERYAVVWEGRRPWRLIGVSQWPILFAGEVAQPWTREENEIGSEVGAVTAWFDVHKDLTGLNSSWAWRPAGDHFDVDDQNRGAGRSEQDIAELERLGMGFLGDDLLVGVGLDDVAQAVVRVKVDEIVGCLRLCE